VVQAVWVQLTLATGQETYRLRRLFKVSQVALAELKRRGLAVVAVLVRWAVIFLVELVVLAVLAMMFQHLSVEVPFIRAVAVAVLAQRVVLVVHRLVVLAVQAVLELPHQPILVLAVVVAVLERITLAQAVAGLFISAPKLVQ